MADATDQIVSKSAFADIVGVSRVRVSQYLAEGKIHGDALVGTGHKARIRVAVAMEQLKRNLDPAGTWRQRPCEDQRTPPSGFGRAIDQGRPA